MRKVLLINPDIPMKRYITQAELFPNGALLLLGTILENKGYEVKIIHMMADKVNLEQLGEVVTNFRPEAVGITAITYQSRTLRETSRVVKQVNREIRVIAGGSHISALISMDYPVSEDYPDIDVFVGGEGDSVISEIIEPKPDSNIIIAEPMKELIVPPVNLDLVDIRRFAGAYPPGPRPGMFVMGSRGCPFNCTFCSRSVFGKSIRYRDPVAVIDDIERLAKNWGVKEIFFHDDTFNFNRKWAEEILHQIINRKLNKKLCFRTPCRVNERLIDHDLLKLMKEAGFWLIFYGVESGSQMMLDRMRKGTKIHEIKRAFKLTREAGIKTEASFIIGLPGETNSTIMESVKLWKDIQPDWCSFTRAIPFPATAVYKEAKESGYLLIDSFDSIEVDKTLCRTEELTGDEIEQYAAVLENMLLRKKIRQMLKNPLQLTKLIWNIKDTIGLKSGIERVWRLLHKAKL